jgi:N-acetylglucosamine-6-phosphate deacetylase
MASAFKNPKSYIEIIIDQVHVAPSVIEWTESLQPLNRLCYISDCVPAAETTPGMIASFGPLKILYADGACRLANGALAGGGKVLTRSFSEWILALNQNGQSAGNLKSLLKERLPCITQGPLFALGIKNASLPALKSRTVRWFLTREGSISVTGLNA